MNPPITGLLLNELNNWIPKYEFSFQFWGEGQNNVFIEKDNVSVADFGGRDTMEEIITVALEWVYRVNQVPEENQIFHKIQND